MILTIKYKLFPTKSQITTFNKWLGVNRFVYNCALEERIIAYKSSKLSVTKYDQYNQLPSIKKELPWIADVYSDVLQESLDRLDKAYQSFFKGSGFPKFQNKNGYNSFTFKRNFKLENSFIKLPKIGNVKYLNTKTISDYKTATIIRENNNWFICITYEVQEPSTIVDNSNSVGIDMGVVNHSTLSNGITYDSQFLNKHLKKLRIVQRKLSRQNKGSNSYEKTKKILSDIHKKVANQRKDFNHKLSTDIVKTYSAVYMENLNIKDMLKRHTLSREILDKGWFQFRTFVQYKCKLNGKHFGTVHPAFTSQTCSDCGNVDKISRISQSEYCCTNCGLVIQADKNAAINIKAKGISFTTKSSAIAQACS